MDLANQSPSVSRKEVIHRCPQIGEFVTPCCGKSPFALPGTDRMTLDAELVTCRSASGTERL